MGVNTRGSLGIDGNDVYYSYGKSPCTNMLVYSEIVWNTGVVGYLTHDVNIVNGSYGK